MERSHNKSMYLKPSGGNALSKLKKESSAKTKMFSLPSGESVTATRMVIPWQEIKTKVTVHKLNPRNQEALTLESISELLEKIKESGVNTEGLAVKNPETGLLELIDASRRAFCCVEAEKDLPLWVIPPIDDKDVLALVDNTQTGKLFSRRERGLRNLIVMEKQGFKHDQELAEYLNVSYEKVRRENVAARINHKLLSLFPDCESINVSFYGKLSKVTKKLDDKSLSALIKHTEKSIKFKDNITLQDKQDKVMQFILGEFERQTNAPKKKEWNETKLGTFSDKRAYAKMKVSPDGLSMKLELSRIGEDKLAEIEKAIKDIVQK